MTQPCHTVTIALNETTASRWSISLCPMHNPSLTVSLMVEEKYKCQCATQIKYVLSLARHFIFLPRVDTFKIQRMLYSDQIRIKDTQCAHALRAR